MTSTVAVIIAALVHIILRWIMYFQRNPLLATPGPQLASIIVCIACLDIIYDNRLYPKICSILKNFYLVVWETAMSIFLLEVCMQIIWPSIEYAMYIIMKSSLLAMRLLTQEQYSKNEELVIGLATVPLALIILAAAGEATDHFHFVYQQCRVVQTQAALRLDNTIRFLRRSEQQQKEILRYTYQNYDAARGLGSRRNARNWKTHFVKPEPTPTA